MIDFQTYVLLSLCQENNLHWQQSSCVSSRHAVNDGYLLLGFVALSGCEHHMMDHTGA